MIRLLIVADTPAGASEMLGRARGAVGELGSHVETVLVVNDGLGVRRWQSLAAPEVRVVLVDSAASVEDRLEAGLLLGPMPEQLIVVGRDPSFSPAQMCFLSLLVELRSDLGAITTGDDSQSTAAAALENGGIFRPGLVVPAGGFLGDRWRSLPDRLADIGADAIRLPAEKPQIGTLSA